MSRLRPAEPVTVRPFASHPQRSASLTRHAPSEDDVDSEPDEDDDREWSLGERVETRALVPATLLREAGFATTAPIATVFVPSKAQPVVTLGELFGVLLGIGVLSALTSVMMGIVALLLFRW